ncbi:hypothetical protein [Psychromonas aquimarina]|uniref:hypothetical protein n=1 Tax=Psychromonas aquimarina TaxID=444919 RepID=UPI0012F732F6|nr:hypothetical protein [Psychromonas aquimarina]
MDLTSADYVCPLNNKRNLIYYCVVLFLLLFISQSASAFGLLDMPGPVKLQPRFKHGAVYTRAIVPGENGAPVYVEYDTQGNVVAEIGEALGDLADLQVMAADTYNAYVLDYQKLQNDYSDVRLLTRLEYEKQKFVTVTDQAVNKKGLNDNTQYVAVLPDIQIVNESGELLVLREFPVNPTVALNPNSFSLLLTAQGDIFRQSSNNIAFRVGFFGDKALTDNSDAGVLGREHGDQIYGPLKHTFVSLNPVFTGGAAVTDEQGKYQLNYLLPPCPGFSIWYQTDVQLQLPYARFNPRGSNIANYYLTRPDSDFCAQYSALDINALAVEATISQPAKSPADFPVDMMVVYGQAVMKNYGDAEIPLAANTKYNHNSKSLYRMARQSADFDGDGEADYAVLGNKVETTSSEGEVTEQFVPSATGSVQGIWLSSSIDSSIKTLIESAVSAQNALWKAQEEDGNNVPADLITDINTLEPIPGKPDFTRLADWSDDFKDRALLSQISDADLGETDIYIFRESTGMLIAEQKGVSSSYRGHDGGVDSSTGEFKYSMKLRGASAGFFDALTTGNKFNDWQAEGAMNPALHQRKADHLKPGEKIKIIALNRKTGYIGTQVTALNTSESGITVYADQIVMYPPNLKIWAERAAGEGYALDENSGRKQVIGNEGAAADADDHIVIYSEWLDNDGFALPKDLSGYGYTGRIAIVSGQNQLSDAGNLNQLSDAGNQKVSHFEIPPGRKTQVIKLPEAGLSTEHIYIQVNGEPSNRNPVFEPGSATDHKGILQYRPEYFVPFKVPVWDEDSSNLQVKAYQQAKESDNSLSKPKPFYQWLYRSEMQFSLYDLNMQEIRVTDAQNNVEDILSVDNPVISSSDQLIDFIYDIATDGSTAGDDKDPLQAWSYNGDKELVFDIGGQEVAVTIDGQTQALSIDDMSLLSDFTAEDLLSVSLYSNNDAGNILWEWGFWYLSLGLESSEDYIGKDIVYVKADKPEIELAATLIGYAGLNDKSISSAPTKIKWSIERGSASLFPAISDITEGGSSVTKVTLTPSTSNIVRVKATLLEEPDTEVISFDIGVIAGKPGSIDLQQNSQVAYLRGKGEVEITATVYDAHGNLVEDGTPLNIKEKGFINLEKMKAFTNNGQLTATITGGSTVGEFEVKVSSGFVETITSVSVHPLNVEIQGIPDILYTGQTYELTALVSGDYQGDLDGLFIDLGVSGGSIIKHGKTTNNAGELNFTYRAPGTSGLFNLGAKIDINNPVIFPINVVDGVPVLFQGAQPALISGTQGETSSQVINYKANTASLGYPTKNSLELTGEPGTSWSLAFDDFHIINKEPVFYSNFRSLQLDQKRKYQSHFNRIVRSASPFEDIQALQFLTSEDDFKSQWFLSNSPDFKIDEPSYNFWLNTDSDGELANISAGALRLTKTGSKLTVKIKADDGEVYEVSNSSFAEGWQAVSVGVKANKLYLAIDDNVKSLALGGAEIIYGELDDGDPWLTFGENFAMKVAGLRIYDWASHSLFELSKSSGKFDAMGRVAVELSLTDFMVDNDITLPSVTVRLKDNRNHSVNVNVLNSTVINKLSKAYMSLSNSDNFSVQEVLTAAPLAPLFPQPKKAASHIASRFALQQSSASAGANVAVALSWLSHDSQYSALNQRGDQLKRYFDNEKYPHLAGFVNEFTQEAIIKSSNGDNRWVRFMVTGLTVWAELLEHDENLADKIALSIQNSTDFWSWIRMLSLPADGWVTDIAPIPRPNITCDKITHNVNAGTFLPYSATPCRATGVQMAATLNVLLEVVPEINDETELFTTYITTLLSSIKYLPIEFKRIFPITPQQTAMLDKPQLIPEAHAIAPAIVYGARLLFISMKQALRKGIAGAPANFVALLQGGTTSRFDAAEILTAIAYLGTRLDDTDFCTDCKKLNEQVSETVSEDIASWFAGLALANKGKMAEGGLLRKHCTISNHAHGKAFEVVGVAAYHALFEFGGEVGLKKPEQYKILLADPREGKNRIFVELKHNVNGKIKTYENGRSLRKPDLVLEGAGEYNRTWIELKSWRYSNTTNKGKAFLNSKNTLNQSIFPLWDGKKRYAKEKTVLKEAVPLPYTTLAHRQHFLDYTASQNALMDYWENDEHEDTFGKFKPKQHKTWIQVWRPGVRSWRPLKKKNGKYTIDKNDKNMHHINVATPWLDESDYLKGVVKTTTPQFRALQKYLASLPTKISNSAYKQSIGESKSAHDSKYRDKQISSNFAELQRSNIVPFNLSTFFALHLGDGAGAKIEELLYNEFGGQYAEIQKAIKEGSLTEEQLEKLREKLFDEVMAILGPLEYLLFDIPLISDIEDFFGDWIMGDELDSLRQAAAELELDPDYFENACEDP